MSIFDALEALEFLDLFLSWRFFVATAVGVACGLAIYYSLGQSTPAGAAGIVVGLGGMVWGFAWQADHERQK